MNVSIDSVPPGINTIFEKAIQLPIVDRLTLAKLLLDSILSDQASDEADWSTLSLDSFQQDWDNPEDAIYDDWRKLYGVSTG